MGTVFGDDVEQEGHQRGARDLAKLFAIGVVTFWNFFMNYFFTF